MGLPAAWLKTAAQENVRQRWVVSSGALRLTEPALKADTQVVGSDCEMAGRFGRPERTATLALQAKLGAELLDPVIDIGAAVVAARHVERADTRRQIGPQRLKLVAGHLEELLPAGVGAFDDALTQDDQPDAVLDDVLHRDAGTAVGVHAASSCRQRVRTGARSAAVRIYCSPRASSSAIMPWVQKPLSARTKVTRTVAGKRMIVWPRKVAAPLTQAVLPSRSQK